MSEAIRAQIALSIAQEAIGKMLKADPALKRDGAASLLAQGAMADLRATRGSRIAAETAYTIADTLVETD